MTSRIERWGMASPFEGNADDPSLRFQQRLHALRLRIPQNPRDARNDQGNIWSLTDRSREKPRENRSGISPDDGRRYQVTHSLGEPRVPSRHSGAAAARNLLPLPRIGLASGPGAPPRPRRFLQKPLADAARPGSKAAPVSAVIRNLPLQARITKCNPAVLLPTTVLRHHVPTVPTPETTMHRFAFVASLAFAMSAIAADGHDHGAQTAKQTAAAPIDRRPVKGGQPQPARWSSSMANWTASACLP